MSARLTNHQKLEEALAPYKGSDRQFSRAELGDIVRQKFHEYKAGSVLPTDHAEPSDKHVNQCSVCRDERYQILTTVVDGDGKPHFGRYKVREFKPSSGT